MAQGEQTPGQVQQWMVPAVPQAPMGQMQVYDPFSILVMLAFAPFYALIMAMTMMQRIAVMPMSGSMSSPSGYKVIGIRRDVQGNIVEIFEKW